MDIKDEELGGQTITVYPDNDLDLVPQSHHDLLTQSIREVFADPLDYFDGVAAKARRPFPIMAKWLQVCLSEKWWALLLEKGRDPSLQCAGFFLVPPKGVRGASIGLPTPFDPTYHVGLATFYRLVGFVDWNGVNLSGKLGRPDMKPSLRSTLAYLNYSGTVVDGATTRLIGGSLCGDQMICTADGHGGWWKHETGTVEITGTIYEFIDWVFGELLKDQPPESDEIYRRR